MKAGLKEFIKKHFTSKKEKKDKSASAMPASTKTETPAATETTPVVEPTPTETPTTAEPTPTTDTQADGGEAKRAETETTDGGAHGEFGNWVRSIRSFSNSSAEI